MYISSYIIYKHIVNMEYSGKYGCFDLFDGLSSPEFTSSRCIDSIISKSLVKASFKQYTNTV